MLIVTSVPHLPVFLFHGPDIDHDFTSRTEYPSELLYRLTPSRGGGKMMNDSNRYDGIETRVPGKYKLSLNRTNRPINHSTERSITSK